MIYKLEEVCEFINGGAWSDKEYVSQGLPVLKVTNCKPKGFLIDDINYLPTSSAAKYEKYKVRRGDVIIATVGSHPNLVDSAAGRSCIVNSLVDGFYLNQNAVCIRTKDTDIFDQVYLGYHTKYREFQHYIQMRGRGAANQMRIAIGAIKGYEFNFPEIDIQRKIAYILYAYDNLIENNQKQIILLEEAAQRLYKEWFIDLRFPGHENVKIINGIPEGWRAELIGQCAELKAGGDKPKVFSEVKTVECEIPVYANGISNKGLMGFTDKSVINEPSVTISARGTVGVAFLRTEPYVPIVRLISVVPVEGKIDALYLYLYFKNQKLRATGAAQQQITIPLLKKTNIIYPESTVRCAFYNLVAPIFSKIGILENQIDRLAEARDRLLPKLMSGELEV